MVPISRCHSSHVRANWVSLIAAALAACGQSQQHAGFAGFPPAEVTTQVIAVRNFPVAFEYVGQTLGSKDVEVRARVTVSRGASEAEVVALAMQDESVRKFVDGKPVRKTIYVQDRLLNFVV